MSIPAYDLSRGEEVILPLFVGVTNTGKVLGDFTVLAVQGAVVLDIDDDLSMAIDEVNPSTAPGYYEVTLTPLEAGTIYLSIMLGVTVLEYALLVSPASTVADPALEGDFVVTVDNGVDPIPEATVRVFNAAGTTLVTRGATDSLGEVTFALAAGQYQLRFSKDGIDFQDDNPTNIIVNPNDDVVPILNELVPATGSIGDVIAIQGVAFHENDSEVIFGTEATVAADFVSARLDLIVVTVPAGLTNLAIPLRVQKPDPNNLPLGKLLSNVITFTRIP